MISLSTALGIGAGLSIAAIAGGAGFYAGQGVGEATGRRIEREVLAAQMESAVAGLTENNRRLEQALSERARKINDANTVQRRREAAAATALRSELDGLRDEVARHRAAAEVAGAPDGLDGSAAREGLLERCAERYSDVAEGAQSLARQVRGLQAFISDVCLSPEAGPPHQP